MVGHSEQGVGQTVVAYIYHDIQVVAPYGLCHKSLALSRAKPGGYGIDDVGISLISGKCDGRLVLAFPLPSPVHQIGIHLIAQLRTAL